MYSSRCYQPQEASRPRSAQPETLPDPWRGTHCTLERPKTLCGIGHPYVLAHLGIPTTSTSQSNDCVWCTHVKVRVCRCRCCVDMCMSSDWNWGEQPGYGHPTSRQGARSSWSGGCAWTPKGPTGRPERSCYHLLTLTYLTSQHCSSISRSQTGRRKNSWGDMRTTGQTQPASFNDAGL